MARPDKPAFNSQPKLPEPTTPNPFRTEAYRVPKPERPPFWKRWFARRAGD
jgi:hypothetical protein